MPVARQNLTGRQRYSLATVGDAVIMVLAHRIAVLFARDRDWALNPRRRPYIIFLLVGLIAALLTE